MLKELEERMKKKHAYLTEKWLGEILPLILPNGTWVHDEKFLGYKPDYRNDELKLIVEFDGADHYQNALVVMRDIKKSGLYEDNGYEVVRIPYFVQLNTQTIKMLFDVDVEFDYGYPHGFISKRAILPASFCEIGVECFFKFVCEHKELEEDIVRSLKEATKRLGSSALALPDSLRAIYFEDYRNKIRHHKEIGEFYLEKTLASNWNTTMVTLYNFLEAQLGAHDFLPILDTDDGAVVGLKWMYRVLDTVMQCELMVEILNEEEVLLNAKVGDRLINRIMSVDSNAGDLLDVVTTLM